LNSALDGGEWSASLPGRLIPGAKPIMQWVGGWVGPKASLDTVDKKGGLPITVLPGTENPSSSLYLTLCTD